MDYIQVQTLISGSLFQMLGLCSSISLRSRFRALEEAAGNHQSSHNNELPETVTDGDDDREA